MALARPTGRAGAARPVRRDGRPRRARGPATRRRGTVADRGARRSSRAGTGCARPALDHADGLLRTSAGSTVAARASLEAAIAGWEALGRTWEAAWATARPRGLPAALEPRVRGDRAAARGGGLRRARSAACPLLKRAGELKAIARQRGAEEEPWRPLTAREFEIARLVAEGHDQQRDRGLARPVAAHGRRPRGAHPREARVHQARGDRGLGGGDGDRGRDGRRRA